MATRAATRRSAPSTRAKRRPRRRSAGAEASGRDKRRVARIQPFVVPCRVFVGTRMLTAYLTDLSPRGARVSSDDPLAAGTRSVVIEVRLSRAVPPSRLHGRVRWRKAGRRTAGEASVFGVTFARVARPELARIRSVLREFRRRAALVA